MRDCDRFVRRRPPRDVMNLASRLQRDRRRAIWNQLELLAWRLKRKLPRLRSQTDRRRGPRFWSRARFRGDRGTDPKPPVALISAPHRRLDVNRNRISAAHNRPNDCAGRHHLVEIPLPLRIIRRTARMSAFDKIPGRADPGKIRICLPDQQIIHHRGERRRRDRVRVISQ